MMEPRRAWLHFIFGRSDGTPAMPHFYFDLVSTSDRIMDPDDQGADFQTLEDARRDAEEGFAELLAEALIEGRPVDFAAIDIRDEDHRLIERLRFDKRGKLLIRDSSGT